MKKYRFELLIFGGLVLCMLFIGSIAYLSETRGLCDLYVTQSDAELMKECYAVAKVIAGPETNPEAISNIATMLYKDTKRTSIFW